MSTPTLYYQHGGIAERVLSRCSSIKLPFNPTLWAPNGHMQSALGCEFSAQIRVSSFLPAAASN
jgi:hypothetical protein